MWLYPVSIGIWPGRGGGACNRELPRIPLPRTSVNSGRSPFSVTPAALSVKGRVRGQLPACPGSGTTLSNCSLPSWSASCHFSLSCSPCARGQTPLALPASLPSYYTSIRLAATSSSPSKPRSSKTWERVPDTDISNSTSPSSTSRVFRGRPSR
jgi:hypothetical protein